jgi:glycosyltransferase involved in cell wall biosynthesis
VSARLGTIVFASPFSLIDYSSGAAIATYQSLELLARSGFRCLSYCAARMDFGEEVCLEETLAEMGLAYQVEHAAIGDAEEVPSGPAVAPEGDRHVFRPAPRGCPGRKTSQSPARERLRLVHTRLGSVRVTVFRNQFTRLGPTREEAAAFLAGYDRFLARYCPSVVLTYGGGPLGDAMIDLARRRGIAVVFGLHNFAYHDLRAFRNVDYVIVPSRFSQHYYAERLGLRCEVMPCAIAMDRIMVRERRPQYLTFVNPQIVKGLYVFARIAEQIARRRPDIPILVVESRRRGRALEETGVDLSWATSLLGMTNTTDPRKFYAVTKVMVMPSLWNESFGLVAAEAMLNGIPVLASDRGALAEIVGDGGFLFTIPGRYTPATRLVPTPEEVEPWVETIIRLWDDEEFYRAQSDRALQWSQRWHPDRLRPLYTEFFTNVHPQAGPPLVPHVPARTGWSTAP